MKSRTAQGFVGELQPRWEIIDLEGYSVLNVMRVRRQAQQRSLRDHNTHSCTGTLPSPLEQPIPALMYGEI